MLQPHIHYYLVAPVVLLAVYLSARKLLPVSSKLSLHSVNHSLGPLQTVSNDNATTCSHDIGPSSRGISTPKRNSFFWVYKEGGGEYFGKRKGLGMFKKCAIAGGVIPGGGGCVFDSGAP